jgi:hypothetical protein
MPREYSFTKVADNKIVSFQCIEILLCKDIKEQINNNIYFEMLISLGIISTSNGEFDQESLNILYENGDLKIPKKIALKYLNGVYIFSSWK